MLRDFVIIIIILRMDLKYKKGFFLLKRLIEYCFLIKMVQKGDKILKRWFYL